MQATLLSIEQTNATAKTFYLRPERRLDYMAGQFIEVLLPHDSPDSRGGRRWFTLSSSPTEDSLAITVQTAVSRSSFKHSLQNLRPGAVMTISDPLGDFVLPMDPGVPLVWIAGGIGITPFRSMARWLADNGQPRTIALFHSVRQRGDVMFADVLAAAGISEHTVVETGKQARLTAQSILSNLPNATRDFTLFYISGPEPMVADTSQALQAAGISSQHIVVDSFLGYR